MEEKTKELLEYLEPFGLGSYQNISPILEKFFPLADRHDTSEVSSKRREPQDFFRGLLDAKYIKSRDTELRGLGSGNSSGGYTWFADMRYEASIDSGGLEALSLDRAKSTTNKTEKSVLTTNASIERLNGIMIEEVPRQTKAMRRTALYAALAVVVAFGAIFKDPWLPDKQPIKELKAIDTLLQKQVQGLDSLNKNLLRIDRTLNTLKDDLTKDTTPKKPH